jgi:hypothetical protein
MKKGEERNEGSRETGMRGREMAGLVLYAAPRNVM